MARMSIAEYSTDPALNLDLGGIDIRGSAFVRNGDDVFRTIMSHLAAGLFGATVTLTSTDASATVGPILDLYRNSASPAVSDVIGQIQFNGQDSAANKQLYGDIYVAIDDPVSGSEDSTINIRNVVAGIITTQASITATGWNGMKIGATTPNTGNFTALTATTSIASSGPVTSSQQFLSSGATVVLAPATGANSVYLRPGGGASTTGQVILDSTGLLSLATNGAIGFSGTGAAATRTNLGVAIGTDIQAYDPTLAALAAFNTNGMLVQTAADTFAARTITGTANEITATNGSGVAGNPTLSLPAALTFTGKTITGGTYASAALNGTLGATTPSTIAATTISASGTITANQNFESSTTAIVLAPTGAGAIFLRPNGSGVATGQAILSSAGLFSSQSFKVGSGATASVYGASATIYTAEAGVNAISARNETASIEMSIAAGTAAGIVMTRTNHDVEIRRNNVTKITTGTASVAFADPIVVPAGSASAVSVGTAATYGIYFPSSNTTVISAASAAVATFDTNGLNFGTFATFGATTGIRINSSGYYSSANTSSSYTHIMICNTSGQVGGVSSNINSTVYSTSSDYRLPWKQGKVELIGSGEFIDALRPYYFPLAKKAGFIAHEFAEVSPSSVIGAKDAIDADGEPIIQSIQPSTDDVMANIVAELQSLRARLAELEAA